MLKTFIYVTVFIAGGALAAGGFHLCKVSLKNKKEMAPYSGPETEVTKTFGKAVVVYYSLSGNTRNIAEKIQKKTNADIYEIKTAEELKAGPKLYINSKKQINSGQYPEIQTPLPDFSKYDLIFAGAPVWWYTAATPFLLFLEQADFHGKKVILFSTQGSNPGTFVKDCKAKAKNAEILDGMRFNNLPKKYDKAVDNKISVWLNSVGS